MRRQILGAMAVSAVALCLSFAAEAKTSTLVYCSEASPEGFSPQLWDTGTTLDVVRPVFNRLVEFKFGTTEIMPSLAESWDISDDGLSYTFHLRKDAQFHTTKYFKPTRDMNADDVVQSFDRMMNKQNPYNGVSGGAYLYFEGMDMPTTMKSVEKIDDHTIKITLAHPEAPFLADLAMEWASVTSKEYADKLLKAKTPEKFDQEPIGTGPFSFVDYTKDATIRYKANPHYFRGKQKIENLVFAITPDASVRKAKLEAGECDIIVGPAFADIAALKANPKLRVEEQEGLNIAYLALNVQKKPFDDKRVRQALNMAFDKDAIIKAVYLGGGKPAKNGMPPTIWSYDDDVKPYPYDPDGAKKLLDEAGVKDLSFDLWYMPKYRPYNPDGKKMGELMQADLAKIGVKANLVTFEWGEYRKRMGNGEHQAGQIGWTGDNGDPDNFLYNWTCNGSTTAPTQNNTKWCNADYDAALKAGKETADVAKRTEFYRKAQEIAHEEAPMVPIAHSIVYMAMGTNVKNYIMDPLGFHNFEGVEKTQ
jgi:dipeptide transport system substrate-binding protein